MESAWFDQPAAPPVFEDSPLHAGLGPTHPGFPFASVIPPGVQARTAWLGAGNNRGFGIAEVDLSFTSYLGYGDWAPLTVSPGFGMHFWSGPRSLPLPPRVYDLYLDLQWRPIDRATWGISCGLTPGFYGDFEQFDDRTFQLTGWLIADVELNENWRLAGGLAYVRQLQSHLLPVGGLIWTPDEDTRLELLIPKPRFARRYRSTEVGSNWWYVSGQLGGGSWAVADTPNSNALVGYSDLRLSLGIESLGVRGESWSAEIGYVFARNITVDDFDGFAPDSTIMLQASILF